MGSYQKLAKQKKETEFQLRILKRWIIETKQVQSDTLKPLMHLFEIKMEDLFELYEIE